MNENILENPDIIFYSEQHTTHKIITELLENYKKETPFYIVDLGDIIYLYEQWRKNLPNIIPYYAVKCNPNPIILKLLSSLGVYFDCASEHEIETILKITKDPYKIVFANPCKMNHHIKYARENNVQLMTFDCEEELYKIKKYHPNANLMLRIAVDDSNSICQFNSKFGCKLTDLGKIFNIIIHLELCLVGFSFHVGSGCKSANSYYSAIENMRTAYDKAIENDIYVNMINIGGGFQGKTNINENEVLFTDIASVICKAQNDFFEKEIDNSEIYFIAEPGRYFVETSHTLILNVIGKKHVCPSSEDESFIYYLNDGIYGSFNCIVFDHKNPVIIPFKEYSNSKLYKSKFFGPTCDSMDMICENILLPELNIGEWVYVENFGAYTTAAASSFNGFKTTDYKYICKKKYCE